MPVTFQDCSGALNQQAVCYTANGQPSSPIVQVSSGANPAPENNIIGLAVGQHFYWRTSTSKLYIFGGTPGTAVGWVILN